MYGNYEFNKQLSDQRILARHQEAAQHRLAKKENPTQRRVFLYRFISLLSFAAMKQFLHLPGKQARPAIQKG